MRGDQRGRQCTFGWGHRLNMIAEFWNATATLLDFCKRVLLAFLKGETLAREINKGKHIVWNGRNIDAKQRAICARLKDEEIKIGVTAMKTL